MTAATGRAGFRSVSEAAVAAFLRDEVPWQLTRPHVPCIGGIGTVAPDAVRSPLLTQQLEDRGVEAWRTLVADGPDELAAQPTWNLAMVLSPYKQEVTGLCDALTPAARATGVVDTLRRGDGGVLGCNTNSTAAAAAVSVLVGGDLPERVLIAGTGASTRSLVAGLRDRYPAARIGVWGRSLLKSTALSAEMLSVEVVPEPAGWDADLVVNATTVGQTAEPVPPRFPLLDALRPGVRFFDLNNRSGALQQAAVSAGCVTVGGVMMQRVTNALRVGLLVGR
ncbi:MULTISPECIES: hypothetical protein [unclassified Modestobacter]|uniref:hypothetical protein n=1 Tax=unclassified Modestobacter TaxID=2643866 RepID=UPI0022AAB310|nr:MULTISPECIES: hypothetical protein [unclassified Modestobacter]MCZ2825031.1 hypothetical protein [Modestobacter sp. VKM Ac-2981]MCZ2854466.1 hypothetical protein [Modestobacter sp. VKM Ac-2982]